MEGMKKKSLKGEFARTVAVTMLAVALASGLAIFGCSQLQKSILPDSNEAWPRPTARSRKRPPELRSADRRSRSAVLSRTARKAIPTKRRVTPSTA